MPQGVSPAVTETVPELEILRERHDKAQASIHEDAQAKLSRLNQEYLQSLDNLIGHKLGSYQDAAVQKATV